MKSKLNEFFGTVLTALVSHVLAVTSGSNAYFNDIGHRADGTFLKIESHAILTGKITSKQVQSAMDCAFECFQTPKCFSYNLGKTDDEGTFICEPLNTNLLVAPLTAMPNYTHYNSNIKTTEKRFTHQGQTGRQGNIQQFVVQETGYYVIEAGGARGGTLSCDYGAFPGTYVGGKGATMKGIFFLPSGTSLKIVVGQRGGDAVEVRGGRLTQQTAASMGLSVEDNAGTGGGGGSFVYTSDETLLLAAGGGGGAAHHSPGVDGQTTTSGSPCSIEGVFHPVCSGGENGDPGYCNTGLGANYHGGVGAGWNGKGCPRKGFSHGETGGSRSENWLGGRAGNMNSGNNGGPPPGAVGGFGGGGGGAEDNGASGGGGGYSGGGSGKTSKYAGGGGGSFCGGISCTGVVGGNADDHGFVGIIYFFPN